MICWVITLKRQRTKRLVPDDKKTEVGVIALKDTRILQFVALQMNI
jgi:hypothetical protein